MQGVEHAGGYFDSLIAYRLSALETAGPDRPGVEVRVEALLAPVAAFRVAVRPRFRNVGASVSFWKSLWTCQLFVRNISSHCVTLFGSAKAADG